MASVTITLVIKTAAPNRAPTVLDTLPKEVELAVGETFDLAPFFSDPDGDALSFMINEQTELAELSPVGVLKALKPGDQTVTITVDDGRG